MKFRYHIIIGGRNPFRPPFNVQRMHFVGNQFKYSGHGKALRNIEQAHQWILQDMKTLNENDTADIMVLKYQPQT